MGRGEYRTNDMLSSKWRDMNLKVRKFNEIYSQKWQTRRSGQSDAMIEREAEEQYREEFNAHFSLQRIWQAAASLLSQQKQSYGKCTAVSVRPMLFTAINHHHHRRRSTWLPRRFIVHRRRLRPCPTPLPLRNHLTGTQFHHLNLPRSPDFPQFHHFRLIHRYTKLSKAWRESNTPPRTPEEASRLVILTLRGHKRPVLEGLLSFYGLPIPYSLDEFIEAPVPVDGLKFELHTLPVDGKTVPDGDGVNVFVATTDARESSLVPEEVQIAAINRSMARQQRNYPLADALHKQIINADYRVLNIDNEEILAHRYRIRLRGIDAPENQQPYGKEAKDEMVKIVDGNCLKIRVFDEDQYGRLVGDVYCNGVLVQKRMLKKGLAWHYTAYDQRPLFAKWEKQARAKGIGLWALPNPEKPWEWRRKHPRD
ncbi:hypothetical protein E3N88_07396 [Mikania micrantha]|uniref:TNase-like domain-containing protein n=1 Tax=Mikania micrantha TaxID=192012 RepID=A0A5N6PTT7_9ASTR|nr:hypothetical protein E3N88_07396 [Mikania micrantha]